MRVAIVGATGFVGSALVESLLAAGHLPRLLVRPGSAGKLAAAGQCEVVPGDLDDEAAISRTVTGVEAVCYLVGIIREFPARGITWERLHWQGAQRVIDAARSVGVGRFLLMSANGVKEEGTGYQQTKFRAEQYLRASSPAWTIFRPSVIFGDPRGQQEFCTQLRHDMIRSPLPAPLFYPGLLPLRAGSFRMAPVHVRNVADCFVQALSQPAAAGRIFPLCGPESLTWAELIQRVAAACGRSKLALPVPVAAVAVLAALFDRFPWFPVTRDQLTMLLEGNVCADNGALRELGVTPIPFDDEHLAYLRD
ncbi:MAG: epimerase [Desulfobulbaceae bacterium A2]|nr:MAG: epimerase [Desulfobulbaceae bacterium A2]